MTRPSRRNIRRLYHGQDGRCFYCGDRLAMVPHDLALAPNGYTIDHVWPRCFGGRNGPTNWTLSCAPCNYSKAAALPTASDMQRAYCLQVSAMIRDPKDWRLWKRSKGRDNEAKRIGYSATATANAFPEGDER